MEPKFVVYECDNCGKLFYREVAEVITDDVDDCHVRVALVNDADGELEEFPMCGCLSGDDSHNIEIGSEEGAE